MFSSNKDAYTISEQDILWNSIVVIFGCGGGGCAVAELLVRNGIGSLLLVDGDKFETSNLNRQIAATQNNIGKAKTDELKKRLLLINPKAHISTYNDYLSENNFTTIQEIIKQQLNKTTCFCVCDTTDSVKNKTMVSDFCQKYHYQLVTGGNGIYNCWVARFFDTEKFNTKKYFISNNITSKNTKTVKAAPCTVWNQASLQSLVIINSLLGRNPNGIIDYMIFEDLINFTLLLKKINDE